MIASNAAGAKINTVRIAASPGSRARKLLNRSGTAKNMANAVPESRSIGLAMTRTMVAAMRVDLPPSLDGWFEALVGLSPSSGSRGFELLPLFMMPRRESYPVGWESGSVD